MSTPRKLSCAVCGQPTQGRQWWNRDTGYGVCIEHGEQAVEREGPETTTNLYGRRGFNWDLGYRTPPENTYLIQYADRHTPEQWSTVGEFTAGQPWRNGKPVDNETMQQEVQDYQLTWRRRYARAITPTGKVIYP